MDCSLPRYSIHGIFQAIVLKWAAISFSRGSSRPRDGTWVSCLVDRRFTIWATNDQYLHQWWMSIWVTNVIITHSVQFSSVQSLSRVRLFVTPWTAACQNSLSITNSGVYTNSYRLSQWRHPTIASLSSPSPAFNLPQHQGFFKCIASGGQSIRVSVSTSVLSMNTQDWSPLGCTACIS